MTWRNLGTAMAAVAVVAAVAMQAGPVGAAPMSKKFSNLKWTFGPDVPHAHLEGAAVAAKSLVYDISGAVSDCSDGVPGATTADVDVYDPATNKFSSAASIPNPRQATPSAVVVGSKIYVVGGETSCGGTPVAAVDVYSIKKNTWTTLSAASDLPAALQGPWACEAGVGKKIYYFLGGSAGILNTAASPPTWTVVSTPTLSPTDFCSAVSLGGNVFVLNPGDGSTDAYSQRVFEFDPKTDTATLQSETTAPYAEESVGVIGKQIVLAGGDFGGNTMVQVLTPSQHKVVTASNSLPDYRDDAEGGSVVGRVMYIVGGQSKSGGTAPRVMIGTPS